MKIIAITVNIAIAIISIAFENFIFSTFRVEIKKEEDLHFSHFVM